MIKFVLTSILSFLFATITFAQSTKIDFETGNPLESAVRNFKLIADGKTNKTVYISAKPGPGVVWIKNADFETGTIDFDIKGKDVLQESFVGFAFSGVNDSTYQAVYFRPFNFLAADPVRKKHAVQYISLPDDDWPYLRENFPDKYESAIASKIDPNNWFHVTLEIKNNLISVFVQNDTKVCMAIIPLNKVQQGKIGFWAGNESDGFYKNLEVKKQR
ncbi:hypothetical protein [Pedobacter miscanthi]|jgi:hypothetical protein|uniref:hypothetical protein n=1 Tax=Pedobacter miscanthi TaxID=2259170 RepID=UPI00292D17AF|nr:hypothetical protein [Pedobacter miscanthi]